MDTFFHQKHCDRCGKDLKAGRIMSQFNTSCLCLECAELEKQDPEYPKAVQAEIEAIRQGNYNFKGIRRNK